MAMRTFTAEMTTFVTEMETFTVEMEGFARETACPRGVEVEFRGLKRALR
jgi:hypothetical protein